MVLVGHNLIDNYTYMELQHTCGSQYIVHCKLASIPFPSWNSWYLYTDCFKPQHILLHTQLVMCWSLVSHSLKHITALIDMEKFDSAHSYNEGMALL